MMGRPKHAAAAARWDRLALLIDGVRLRQRPGTRLPVSELLQQHLSSRSDDFAFWAEFVTLSSAHAAVPALAPALIDGAFADAIPGDVAAYVTSMEEANAKRNRRMADGLHDVASALNSAGIVPLVGKGGAFLARGVASGDVDQVRWRFLSDLDLYVSEDELFPALETLIEAGFVPVSESYDPDRMAHYPPLISPCQTYSVEIHTRLFARKGDFANVADLQAQGVTISLGDAQVQIPSDLHRLAHLVAHAQLHNRFFALKRMFVRDLADLQALIAEQPDRQQVIGLAELLDLFPLNSDRNAIASFFALADIAMGETFQFDQRELLTDPNYKWARGVLDRYLMHPTRHRIASSASLVGHEAKVTLLEPGGFRRLRGVVAAPGRIATWARNERRKSQSVR